MIGRGNLSTRNNWIKEQLLSLSGRILDAGAGELQWKPYCIHLDYVSQDFAQYDGKGDGLGLQCKGWAGNNVDIVCDITDIPEPDSSYDAVLCSEVLDHVPDPVWAVQELARLLKPGGTLLLTESFCGLTNQSPYFYYTGLSKNWYEHWLTDFDVEITYNGNYYEWIAQELGRLVSWGDVDSHIAGLILLQLEVASEKRDTSDILCFGLLVKAIKHV